MAAVLSLGDIIFDATLIIAVNVPLIFWKHRKNNISNPITLIFNAWEIPHIYFIYLYSNQSKKVGKPTVYGTSLNELNVRVHTKYTRRITMNTLLQIYVNN